MITSRMKSNPTVRNRRRTDGGRKFYIDWTMNIGNLITLIGILGAVVIGLVRADDKITRTQEKVSEFTPIIKQLVDTQNQMAKNQAVTDQILKDRLPPDRGQYNIP